MTLFVDDIALVQIVHVLSTKIRLGSPDYTKIWLQQILFRIGWRGLARIM